MASTAASKADLAALFIASLENAAGVVVACHRNELADRLRALSAGASTVINAVAGLRGFAAAGSAKERDFATVDLFVCEGQVGVAENGAVWITEEMMVHRSALFLSEHVVIVLDRSAIVPTLHEAYEKIDVRSTGFGLFVAGPSKTADIEQSLVIGAHGPRSLTVFLVD